MKKKIILGFAIISLSSCSGWNSYPINVTAVALPDNQLSKYKKCSLKADYGIDSDSILYKEYVSYAKLALKDNGISIVPDSQASCRIFLSYGVSEPKEQISTEYVATDSYQARRAGIRLVSPADSLYKNDYVPVTATKVTYERWLKLDARRKSSSGRGEQLWEVSATSEGEGNNLRTVYPYMLAALDGVIQHDVAPMTVYVSGEDATVKYYQSQLGISQD